MASLQAKVFAATAEHRRLMASVVQSQEAPEEFKQTQMKLDELNAQVKQKQLVVFQLDSKLVTFEKELKSVSPSNRGQRHKRNKSFLANLLSRKDDTSSEPTHQDTVYIRHQVALSLSQLELEQTALTAELPLLRERAAKYEPAQEQLDAFYDRIFGDVGDELPEHKESLSVYTKAHGQYTDALQNEELELEAQSLLSRLNSALLLASIRAREVVENLPGKTQSSEKNLQLSAEDSIKRREEVKAQLTQAVKLLNEARETQSRCYAGVEPSLDLILPMGVEIFKSSSPETLRQSAIQIKAAKDRLLLSLSRAKSRVATAQEVTKKMKIMAGVRKKELYALRKEYFELHGDNSQRDDVS